MLENGTFFQFQCVTLVVVSQENGLLSSDSICYFIIFELVKYLFSQLSADLKIRLWW